MNNSIPDGLLCFADSHDTAEKNQEATIATLLACGATVVSPCALGQNGSKPKVDTLRRLQRLCDAHAIAVRPFVFPSVITTLQGMAEARTWTTSVSDTLGVPMMLDAEPQAGSHWTPRLLEAWLAMDERMSITTTRAEAPHLGAHDREVVAQFERQDSIDTLDAGLRIFERYSPPDAISVCTGAFSQSNDPRTDAEFAHDLERCSAKARAVRKHALWSAHTLSASKASIAKGWALGVI